MKSFSTSVLLLRPPQFMRSSYALTLDVLATANQIASARGLEIPFSCTEVGLEDIAHYEAFDGLVILPSLALSSEAKFKAALVDGSMHGIKSALLRLQCQNTIFATSCSGTFAFAHAGLLNGRCATTTWWLAPTFSRLFPQVKLAATHLVVEDGPIITAGAALAHIDLMIRLVERFAGYALARECRHYLVADHRRSQSPYASMADLIANDSVLLKAERHVQENLSGPINVGDLASLSGLTPRTFARRLKSIAGTTPVLFVQNLRVSRAVDLALTTKLTSDQIAADVGYSDANALRRVMKKQIGKTIEALRA